MRTRIAVLGVVCSCALGPSAARAAEPSPSFPMSVPFLPVESAFLRSNVDLQFLYTRIGVGNADVNALQLGLEAQIALADRLEIGVTIPFLVHAFASLGARTESRSEFGNIALNLKGLLAGKTGAPFALSLFANTTFPTTTLDLSHRELFLIHGGLAASAFVARIVTAGLDLAAFWALNGRGSDAVLYLTDFFLAVSPLRILAFQLAIQLAIPVHPQTGDPAVSVFPAVQIFPDPRFRIDLGARIGVNDGGKVYSLGGRAAVVFAAGYVF